MTLFVFTVLGNLHSLSLAFFQFRLGTEGVSPDAVTPVKTTSEFYSPHNFKAKISLLFSQYSAVLDCQIISTLFD